MTSGAVRAGAVLAAVLMIGACASEGDDGPLLERLVDDESGGSGEPRTPETPGDVAVAAFDEVRTYWEGTFPEVYGGPLEPLTGGSHPYAPGDLPPPCGPLQISYEEIAQNAFYCPPPQPGEGDWQGDFIAWDEEALLPWLAEEFSSFTIAIVLAHEYGHAVQQRNTELETGSSVRVEMQADCYSGAWTRWVAAGNSEAFSLTEEMLDASLAGMISIRDQPGTNPNDPWAHGSGFDRVNAFQEGYEQGAARCAQYPELERTGDLVVTEIEFSAREAATGGNMPLEDQGAQEGLYSLAEETLNQFYADLFARYTDQEWQPVEDLLVVDPARDEVTCGGETHSGEALEWASHYCADENVAVFDGVNLAGHLYEMGDFAVAAEIARLWALSAQEQLGVDGGVDASLQADCLNGVWAAALWEGSEADFDVRLSAGDLDEAIMGMLSFGSDSRDQAGTVFERTAALRAGFLDGMAGCEGILPLG